MASPIEAQFFDALLDAAQSWYWVEPGDGSHPAPLLRIGGDRDVFVFRDVALLAYRVDFVLVQCRPGGQRVVLAIECDGHDFHDRTKQQAAYDRARDRELLLRKQIVTVRFTGSEIFHSSERCAHEAIDIFLSMSDRAAPSSKLDISGAMGG